MMMYDVAGMSLCYRHQYCTVGEGSFLRQGQLLHTALWTNCKVLCRTCHQVWSNIVQDHLNIILCEFKTACLRLSIDGRKPAYRAPQPLSSKQSRELLGHTS